VGVVTDKQTTPLETLLLVGMDNNLWAGGLMMWGMTPRMR
jgi:hypothetical protein